MVSWSNYNHQTDVVKSVYGQILLFYFSEQSFDKRCLDLLFKSALIAVLVSFVGTYQIFLVISNGASVFCFFYLAHAHPSSFVYICLLQLSFYCYLFCFRS